MTTFLMYIKLYFPFKKNPVNKEKYSFKVYFTMLDGVDVALTTNLFFQMIQHKTPRSKSFDAKLPIPRAERIFEGKISPASIYLEEILVYTGSYLFLSIAL